MSFPQLDSTSIGLLTRARGGDGDAWYRVVALYGPHILKWCSKTPLRSSDAPDVCQEVLRKVLVALPDFQRKRRGSFRNWLRRITHRAVYDLLRVRNAEPLTFLHDDVILSAVEQSIERSSSGETSAAASNGLIEQTRRVWAEMRADFEEQTLEAYTLTAVEGFPAKEVAEMLGMSVDAVYKARSRVSKRLRERLPQLLAVENDQPAVD